ncbi:MAG: glycosyltransferase family 2 protein [Candidatus Omnitrophica bacterium]|nr:glycosyltransferase family 2 protein [Candidatus Omnitrophota bacterium]
MPNVSVIIPIYNRAQYLPDAVNSVLNQSYKDFEIIIVDDGSTDNTREVAERFIRQHPSVIRYFSQANKGPSAARNKGITEARGQYVAFLDADDEWLPEFLQKTTEAMVANACQWVYTNAYRLELDASEATIKKDFFKAPVAIGANENLYSAVLREDVIGGPSKVVIMKECFKKVGGFHKDFRIREDWEMWIRLAKHGFKICKVEEPLYIYKVRKNSTTKSNPIAKFIYEYKIVCSYAPEAFALHSSYREIYAEKLWSIARQILCMEKKDYRLFVRCIIKSQLFDPSLKRIIKSLRTMIRHKKGCQVDV